MAHSGTLDGNVGVGVLVVEVVVTTTNAELTELESELAMLERLEDWAELDEDAPLEDVELDEDDEYEDEDE